jgi:hypothetical protein
MNFTLFPTSQTGLQALKTGRVDACVRELRRTGRGMTFAPATFESLE